MPRRNRVTPLGEIIAVSERGTMMGNRGILHDAEGRIRRPWAVKRWLICVLEFRGRHRTIMAPNRYTELFFLDEATALAAGHRPCYECRRDRYLAFRDAWAAGNPELLGPEPIRADDIDDRLHAERAAPDRSKRTERGCLDDLPDGVFINLDGSEQEPHLIWDHELLTWSPGGYRQRRPRPRGEVVTILTPGSTVRAIRSGYVPEVYLGPWNTGRTTWDGSLAVR
jgi:hypothetical protein